jgi:predicted phage terminase large subunit-like protein
MKRTKQLFSLSDQIINDPIYRAELARKSHWYFFHTYLNESVVYPTAPFQKEIFDITEDDLASMAVIVAFRGSAKSTIITMSYPIWAILGRPKKKFVVLISQTQEQARSHFKNLKKELESNELLRKELGPFQEDEWNSNSIILSKYNARITHLSSDQAIRGLKHGNIRPQLIICDDIEDVSSTKTREGRDKTYKWLTQEVIPSGDKDTKVIVIGNLLHEDSTLMRLKAKMESGKMKGVFREYPLVRNKTEILWPGKFRSLEEVEEMHLRIGDEISWQREYMLNIIPDEEQIVKREMIQYYPIELPLPDSRKIMTATGIDLAISLKDTADYTAMVTGKIFKGEDHKPILYIMPNPINKRMEFPEAVQTAKAVSGEYKSTIYAESVTYQGAFAQHLQDGGVDAQEVKPGGKDKRMRLNLITPRLANGQVLFPSSGCEQLIEQLLGFGKEKHDDLVDAFVYLVTEVFTDCRYVVTSDDFSFE